MVFDSVELFLNQFFVLTQEESVGLVLDSARTDGTSATAS